MALTLSIEDCVVWKTNWNIAFKHKMITNRLISYIILMCLAVKPRVFQIFINYSRDSNPLLFSCTTPFSFYPLEAFMRLTLYPCPFVTLQTISPIFQRIICICLYFIPWHVDQHSFKNNTFYFNITPNLQCMLVYYLPSFFKIVSSDLNDWWTLIQIIFGWKHKQQKV